MKRRIRKLLSKKFRHRTTPGSAPGVVKSVEIDTDFTLRLTQYGHKKVIESNLTSLSDVHWDQQSQEVFWLDVIGLGNAELIEAIGERYGLHALALEDAVHVHQRPKVDEYDSHLFVVARMTNAVDCPGTEQVSMFLGKNFVITFQERDGDCFEPVRERIRQHSRIRTKGADYLMYALIDAILDNYFPRMEEYRERLEHLEDHLMKARSKDAMTELHEIRRDLRQLRKLLWQHRESINSLLRLEHDLINRETSIYVRDCYDHSVQLLDVAESYREYCTDLRDLHLAEVSMKTNDVMKVLTLIATVFMPMSFIAGLYGMNFDHDVSPWNMPETHWTYGYPFAIVLMIAIALVLLLFFWRKGWIGERYR